MRAGKAGAETRYHSSVARREIWVGSLLLASVVCSALPRSDAYRWGTEEAIARLDRLKEEAAEQEKLVEALRKVLTPASQSAMTCSAHDHECHSHKRRVQDRRRKVSLQAALLYMRFECASLFCATTFYVALAVRLLATVDVFWVCVVVFCEISGGKLEVLRPREPGTVRQADGAA